MKKLFLISLILIVLISEAVFAQEQEEDLYIRIEALKERQYSSIALTDQYETEILTAKSSEYSVKIAKIKERKTKQLTSQLFLNIKEKESSASQIQEQTAKAGLFADGYKAKSTSGNMVQKQKNIIMIILCTIGCIAVGYTLAVVWRRFRERQML